MNTESRYYLGVDLGQSQDPTAVAALRRDRIPTGKVDAATREPCRETVYWVTGVRRLPLRIPYTEIVRQVAAIRHRIPEGIPVEVVVDATGVGAPVVELLRAELKGAAPVIPVIFTGGDSVNAEGDRYRVPKKDLVHGLAVALQKGQLRIAERSGDAPALLEELNNLHVKISSEGHAGYEAWREGHHDDLVFALALACWRARSQERRPLYGSRRLFW